MSSGNYIDEDEVHVTIRDIKSFIDLLSYAKDQSWNFIIALTTMGLSISILTGSARLIGFVVEFLGDKDWYQASLYSVYVVLAELAGLLLLWRGRRRLVSAASKTILEIRKSIFRHINQLPISYFDRQPEGRTITRMTHDVEGIEEFFTSALGRLINSIISFVVVVIAMFLTDLKLGAIVTLSIVPAAILIFGFRTKIRKVSREISKKNSACNSSLSENINGLEVIRGFGIEKWVSARYDTHLDGHLKAMFNANGLYCIIRPVTSFFCHFPVMILLLIGGPMAYEGAISVGILVAFVRYCERFSFPIMSLAREMHVIQQAFTSAERVSSFLNATTENCLFGGDGKKVFDSVRGEISFKNVVMEYDKGKSVLNGINLHIEAGERIGFVGATGCGKTTTVSLLSRLYDYKEGSISIDGTSIRDIKRSCLRERIGFVSQDVAIFRGTFLENLSCGKKYSYDKVVSACKETGLFEVMSERLLKLDSQILDYGNNLSVGERQLISLTRVLLSDPDILVLDEATASIDPELERIIHRAVDKIMESRTCLIIAHRLDTLKTVDRIIVMSDGRVVEDGTHRHLLNLKGDYYALHLNSSEFIDL